MYHDTYQTHTCGLYVEKEYEALVLECNWKSKTNVKHSNNYYIYRCIHCSQQFNGISYQRFMNFCKSWIGPGVVKMYPMWICYNNSKLKKIALKFEKDTKYTCQTSCHKWAWPSNEKIKKYNKNGLIWEEEIHWSCR